MCREEDLTEGKGKSCRVDLNGCKEDIGVFKIDGKIYAIDNLCPHADAPLSEGDVENGVVVCPLHLWCYNLKNGAPVWAEPGSSVTCYQVRVKKGNVYVYEYSTLWKIVRRLLRVFDKKAPVPKMLQQ